MSIPSFDPKTVSGYGSVGQKTAQKMYESLSAHFLGLFYEPSTKTFTILDSASLEDEKIKQIFAKNYYEWWKPELLKEVDSDGNHLVRLIHIRNPFDRSPQYYVKEETSYIFDVVAPVSHVASGTSRRNLDDVN